MNENETVTPEEMKKWEAIWAKQRKAKNPALYYRMKLAKWALLLFLLYAVAGTLWNLATQPEDPHTTFIRQTSDLPSSTQRQLDQIYKADPARAHELSTFAHQEGVQNLEDTK